MTEIDWKAQAEVLAAKLEEVERERDEARDIGDANEGEWRRIANERLDRAQSAEALLRDCRSLITDSREIVTALGDYFMDLSGDDGEIHKDLIARYDEALPRLQQAVENSTQTAGDTQDGGEG